MNCKTLLIKQVLPGLVVLAIGFSEQGLNVSFPAESLPQPAPADEILPETASTDNPETIGADNQTTDSSSYEDALWERAVEWVEGYSFSRSNQNKSFSTESNAYRAGPGAFWPLAAWNLLFIDSAPYTPGMWGSEIGQRSALKSLSP